jgi:hypothetical protein
MSCKGWMCIDVMTELMIQRRATLGNKNSLISSVLLSSILLKNSVYFFSSFSPLFNPILHSLSNQIMCFTSVSFEKTIASLPSRLNFNFRTLRRVSLMLPSGTYL